MFDDIQSWERQNDEPEKAFEIFQLYRDLGNQRTIPEVIKISNKNPRTVHKYAAQYEWRERAADYDRYRDRIQREEIDAITRRDYAEKVADYRNKVDTLGMALLNIGARTLTVLDAELVKRLASSGVENLSPAEIANLLNASIKACDIGTKLRGEVLAIDKMLDQFNNQH